MARTCEERNSHAQQRGGRDGGWGLVQLERRGAVAEGTVKKKFLSRFSNRVLKTERKLYAE